MAPREVVMGLDDVERGVGIFGGVIALVLAAIYIPHLTKNTWITETAKPTNNKCPEGYKLVLEECQKHLLTHPSYWIPQFVATLVIGASLIIFSILRKRAGVCVAAFLLGLDLGTAGLVFLFLGGWLVVRAFRLQKYGDATFRGSNAKAREMAKAKKEGREYVAAQDSDSTKPAPKAATPPVASKRYTPKKPPRKR